MAVATCPRAERPSMRLIATSATVELEARKSRFIGEVHRVVSEEQARELIELTRKRYWNANHTCSAWRIGDGGALQRTNDDGEPGGSAGLPILDVLRHRDLTNVVAVVTRYFGGTKLGVGGLIRAYGSAVSEAIARAGIVEVVTFDVAQVLVSHGNAGRFENALRSSPLNPKALRTMQATWHSR